MTATANYIAINTLTENASTLIKSEIQKAIENEFDYDYCEYAKDGKGQRVAILWIGGVDRAIIEAGGDPDFIDATSCDDALAKTV
jgi:hypothetical protein